MTLHSNRTRMILRGGSVFSLWNCFRHPWHTLICFVRNFTKKGLLFVSRIGECVAGITEGSKGLQVN